MLMMNYKFLSKLGRGSFGVVKLAIEKSTGKKVAIKILDKRKISKKEEETRILKEKEIIKSFDHINVIKVFNIDEDPQKIYFIMEYCEKGELLNYVVKKRKLDEDEASYFYFQLINGLENIHYHGICHRDLKFGNLLINSSDILKIIDFGLSNYYDNINLLSSRCGSSFYASPELISKKKYNGFTSDIWSSGIILYGMLCGYLPFDDKNPKVLYYI